ncbi:hypothetical protein [Pontibacter sp. G13]|uniref:hypothetical protein n=1 Tax=Pontibacter sp. G13 TaxID=3074898 RepID=UPI00288ADC87|nr:hypothetical protein [Pontibacter sp. G13]WNJ18151.1 hypothetical protein RJD25_25140 [Pontibacter sp. G13]
MVFRLFSSKGVNQTHWQSITNGVGLTKAGKALVVEAFNEYVQGSKIRHRGRSLTRQHALQLDAHTYANALIDSP